MRSTAEYARVSELIERGLNNCEIERVTGVPRTTVRDWRHGRGPARVQSDRCQACGHPLHDFAALPQASYAYILGMYLGDGDISRIGRTWRLRISLDMGWPGIAASCLAALEVLFPSNRVSLYRPDPSKLLTVASVYSNQLLCLFPQHGPGRKHGRRIELVRWQSSLVSAHTEDFLRGLIHSDGSRSLNTVSGNGVAYRYPRYTFSNRSDDIRSLFTASCDRLGIQWRKMNRWNISIARRASVARLDEFVGPKD